MLCEPHLGRGILRHRKLSCPVAGLASSRNGCTAPCTRQTATKTTEWLSEGDCKIDGQSCQRREFWTAKRGPLMVDILRGSTTLVEVARFEAKDHPHGYKTTRNQSRNAR